ncbi:putative MFS multidrug transporter [Apodospora peruviana]|uniref:MFS multidrug transporter n=1 Tax=Apodospora peruviana TaxID=516989 RepID=A0AAE0HVE0_9PEZI|nr:putative MFS multidrug transporter [Apodospora peruviana]
MIANEKTMTTSEVHADTDTDAAAPEKKRTSGDTTDVAEEITAVNNDDEKKEGKWIEGWALFMLLGSVTIVVFLMLLDMTIVGTAIPQITNDFQSLADVGWYGSAYNLASAALQPLSGKLYTHFKTKWTFIAFVLMFLLGSLLCGVAQSSKMLIVGRAVAGLGTSGIQNGGITIISQAVPLHKRPTMIGIIMGCGQLGVVVGPLIGGAITEYSTWRWCFYLNLPAGALALALLCLVTVPDNSAKQEEKNTVMGYVSKLDLVGSVIFAPAAIMLLMALEYGGRDYPWGSATVIGLFVGAAGTLLLFGLWEHRKGADAMIPLKMAAKREVWTSAVVGLLVMGGLLLVPGYFLPIFFQSVGGQSPLMSGVFVLPSILSNLVMAVLSGVLVGKLGYTIPWVLFCGIVSAIGSGILTTLHPDTSHAMWVGFLIVLGIGRGTALQMPLISVQAILPEDQIPTSMALLIFSQTIGGAIFITIANTIFANSLVKKLVEYVPDIDVPRVLAAGATGFTKVVPDAQLPGVLRAYADSIDLVFYLPVAAALLILVFAWGMGWNDIREKKTAAEKEKAEVAAEGGVVGGGASV